LVEDLRAFLDEMGIEKVSLIGHSIAGDQLTRLAAVYPERVNKLVYLDAAYDRSDLPGLFAHHPSPAPPAADPVLRQLQQGSEASNPDFMKIAAPALGYFVIPDRSSEAEEAGDAAMKARLQDYFTRHVLPYVRRNVERFRQEIADGCVVELRGTHHSFFVDRPVEVAGQIEDFLLEAAPGSGTHCPAPRQDWRGPGQPTG